MPEINYDPNVIIRDQRLRIENREARVAELEAALAAAEKKFRDIFLDKHPWNEHLKGWSARAADAIHRALYPTAECTKE